MHAATMTIGRAFVGTSGWVFDHWRGTFYPEEMPHSQWLRHYAMHLRSVEVNSTFYRLLTPHVAEAWLRTVPNDFTFALKAHRYITHRRRLEDVGDPVARFLTSVEPLADRLGVVLFQLPPFLPFDPDRLDVFLDLLPRDVPYPYVFEFRNPTWHNEQTFELLRVYGDGYCVHDFEGQTPIETTSGVAYLRLHGPEGPYRGRYTLENLLDWAEQVQAWRQQGLDAWVFFNNDEAGYAPVNAIEFEDLLPSAPPRPRESAVSHA